MRALAFGSRPVCQSCYRRTLFNSTNLRKQTPEPQREPVREEQDSEVDKHALKQLGRPIGFRNPPNAGENAPARTFGEWKDNFLDRDKNTERRKELYVSRLVHEAHANNDC